MVNKPLERPEMTRERIEFYINQGRQMRSEEMGKLINTCVCFVSNRFMQAAQRVGQLLSVSSSKLRDRLGLHLASHAKH